jgi:hypothetical protein
MDTAVGRVMSRTITSRRKQLQQTWIYIPKGLAESKEFPFQGGEQVLLIVDGKGKRLVVEKLQARTV